MALRSCFSEERPSGLFYRCLERRAWSWSFSLTFAKRSTSSFNAVWPWAQHRPLSRFLERGSWSLAVSRWVFVAFTDDGCDVTPRPTSFAELVSDDFPVLHAIMDGPFVSISLRSPATLIVTSGRRPRTLFQWLGQWWRSITYRVSNARSASTTVIPIPTIPSSTLAPRSAIHNPLRNDNCGPRVAVGLLGCEAQYFIISSAACSCMLICSVSTADC